MAVKVIVPSKIYNGEFFGVQFENGVGIFEDEKVAKEVAQTLGYEIEQIEAEKKEPVKKAPAKRKSTKKVEE